MEDKRLRILLSRPTITDGGKLIYYKREKSSVTVQYDSLECKHLLKNHLIFLIYFFYCFFFDFILLKRHFAFYRLT